MGKRKKEELPDYTVANMDVDGMPWNSRRPWQIFPGDPSKRRKEFDVKPYIRGEWYGKLHDRNYFNAVETDGYTVVWPEGKDICPDELYELSKMPALV